MNSEDIKLLLEMKEYILIVQEVDKDLENQDKKTL